MRVRAGISIPIAQLAAANGVPMAQSHVAAKIAISRPLTLHLFGAAVIAAGTIISTSAVALSSRTSSTQGITLENPCFTVSRSVAEGLDASGNSALRTRLPGAE